MMCKLVWRSGIAAVVLLGFDGGSHIPSDIARLQAQSAISVRDGVYSVEQAKRGEELYATTCASCHGAKLEGRNQAPPLAGTEFSMNWDGQPLSDLSERIQTSMPADKPGSLSAKEVIGVIALMLRENGLPAGANELPADAEQLKRIKFEAGKGK